MGRVERELKVAELRVDAGRSLLRQGHELVEAWRHLQRGHEKRLHLLACLDPSEAARSHGVVEALGRCISDLETLLESFRPFFAGNDAAGDEEGDDANGPEGTG